MFVIVKMLMHLCVEPGFNSDFLSIRLNSLRSSGVLIPLADYLAKASNYSLFMFTGLPLTLPKE
jgi:hypothetical protein